MRAVVLLLVALLLSACTSAGEEPPDAGSPVSTPPGTSQTPTPTSSPDPSSPAASPTATTPTPPPAVSLPALFEKSFRGGDLRLRELRRTAGFIEYHALYRSGRLTISGQLLRPHGPGPYPAVVMAHGYIDPAIYVNGQGLTREQDYLAGAGYVVLHVDYRGHADSSPASEFDRSVRLGYTEDVINAVLTLKRQTYVDPERVALLGRSMGGSVVYNALVAQPGLVKAGVVFAPVSSDIVDNYHRWISRDPSRTGVAAQLVRRLGPPGSKRWSELSARTYFDRITEPLLIHHGTLDDSCPIRWSRQTKRALTQAGKDAQLFVYDGEGHAFGPQWPLSMQRTVRFLSANL